MPQTISPDLIRVCKLCGEKFHPTARKQFCCNQMKPRKCAVCGSEFLALCSTGETKQTCSPECKKQFANSRRSQSFQATTRTCKWCGKEFNPKSVRQFYCEDTHYQTCAVCGKSFVINPANDDTVKTCSSECRYKLMIENTDREQSVANQKAAILEKYGVENVMQIPGVVDKIKQSNLERYGSEWYTQTDEYKKKVEETDLAKYGVKHHLQSQVVIDKRINTVQEKYNVNNVFQSQQIKEKSRQTNIEKYGVEYVSQSPEIQHRITENNIARYGAEHPMMLKEFQDKAAETNTRRYGRRAYTQQHIKDIENWYRFINDTREYITEHYNTPPRAEELAKDFGVEITAIHMYLDKSDCRDCVRRAKSLMEEEITNFIKDINPGCRIINNDKTAIKPLELDIYIPDLNFAIECNPTATHNSSCADPWGGEPKHRKYHKNKTDACEQAGIELFHVFGYDWSHKKDIILSMIRNKVVKDNDVIYARNCNIVEVPGQEAMKFLNENHRQGQATSPINIGLKYDNRLVSLMTFSRRRGTIGKYSDGYELVRFCSLLNTTVVGGASKLLKHFIDTYRPEQIISFSDRAHTSGNLYCQLGFHEISRSDANYMWVEVASDRSYHRMNAQKANLKRFLKDDNVDLNQTEVEIMTAHGFVQVFDSGTITWEWNRYCTHEGGYIK